MQKSENKISKLLIDTCILPGRHICQIAFSFFLSRVYFKRKVFATEVAITKNAYSNKLKISYSLFVYWFEKRKINAHCISWFLDTFTEMGKTGTHCTSECQYVGRLPSYV